MSNTRIEGVYMPILKSVDMMSLAKIATLFGVVVGLVMGIFYWVIAAAIGIHRGFAIGAIAGIALVIIMPILGAVCGFISGVVHAFLYNVFAKWVGGVNLEFQQ
jgi:predicted PurR-regulated permease PerM